MTRGTYVSSPGRARQSSGTTTCLMDKVSPVAKPQCFEGSFPLPSSGCHLGAFFLVCPTNGFLPLLSANNPPQ